MVNSGAPSRRTLQYTRQSADFSNQGTVSWLLVANVSILAAIIKRSVEQKNPYKNEIFTDQKNYKDALLRAAEANREIA